MTHKEGREIQRLAMTSAAEDAALRWDETATAQKANKRALRPYFSTALFRKSLNIIRNVYAILCQLNRQLSVLTYGALFAFPCVPWPRSLLDYIGLRHVIVKSNLAWCPSCRQPTASEHWLKAKWWAYKQTNNKLITFCEDTWYKHTETDYP